GGRGGVAEDAVGGRVGDGAGADRGEEFGQRGGGAGFGQAGADQFRGDGEQHRGLGPSGVGVGGAAGGGQHAGAREPGARRAGGLGAQDAQCRGGGFGVAAVPADEHGVPRPGAGGAGQVEQGGGDRLDGQPQGSGEGAVLAAGPVGQGGGDRGAVREVPRGGVRQVFGDPHVGVERQVRPVLLHRADRDQQYPMVGGLRRGQLGEPGGSGPGGPGRGREAAAGRRGGGAVGGGVHGPMVPRASARRQAPLPSLFLCRSRRRSRPARHRPVRQSLPQRGGAARRGAEGLKGR